MGFWSGLSDFAKNPLGENSGVAKTLAPVVKVIRNTAPDTVDSRFVGLAARGTRQAGAKSPLISRDPVLARQEADTAGDPAAPSGTQMQHKLGAAATIAATVYGAGAMGGSGGEAGAVNSFDSGAMWSATGGGSAAPSGGGFWASLGSGAAAVGKTLAPSLAKAGIYQLTKDKTTGEVQFAPLDPSANTVAPLDFSKPQDNTPLLIAGGLGLLGLVGWLAARN